MNKIFINKKLWNTFNSKEMLEFKKNVFDHYKKNGFPYFPTNEDWRLKEFKKLKNYDFKNCIDHENKLIKQTMHGLSLCWSYQPHHYEVKCNKMRTVIDTFNNDELLKQVINKRIMMGDNMSDNGLRKMLKVFTGTQCVSNFRPTAAAAIYSMFCNKGDSVYDMSAGYGGRCLGAYLAEVKYNAVDPCTKNFNGIKEMANNINYEINLEKQGSESRTNLKNESIDFCFTSPPYFDCEKYSDEETQSYIKYPTKNEWLNGYMVDTIKECYRVLKKNKKLVLNVQNVKSYRKLVLDVEKIVLENGFKKIDEWGLQLSRLGKGGYKSEPILVFEKI